MTIDRSGKWWTGTDRADIDEYLAAYSASNYPATRTIHAACSACGGTTFRIRVDDEQGCAERTCTTCQQQHLIFDSQDTLDEAELDDAERPCGGGIFQLAGGFALREDGEVKWVYLGARCTQDGVLGVYTDWKIDYGQTAHLFDSV